MTSGTIMNGHRGFTLVEIIIAIVIIGIIGGIAALIITQGVRAFSDEQSRSDVHYQARLGMERMARDIKLIRRCSDIAGMANPSAALSFTDINDVPVVFSLAGTDLMRNADVLARNVTALQFNFIDGAGAVPVAPTCGAAAADTWMIEAQMTVTDPRTAEWLDIRTRVHPRNF